MMKQDLAEPDPLRLAWRNLIRQALREVIKHPENDPIAVIEQAVSAHVPKAAQRDVQSLIVQELRRLHEGVLMRYGLRPAEYEAWKTWRATHG